MEEFKQLIEEFEAMTKDAERVQEECLKKILEENGSTEYLQKLGLNGRTDQESFKACVPIVTYKELEPYIQRIVDGDPSPILTGKPFTNMSLSSGTSEGKSKYIPFNNELMKTAIQRNMASFAFRNREFPVGNGKELQFTYKSKQFKTKGGLVAAAFTTNCSTIPEYVIRMTAIHSRSCSPEEVIRGDDFHQSLYCHLLCGLIICDEIESISSLFAHNLVLPFRKFEQVWEELCDDIRAGTVSERINLPEVRTAMSKLMRPNPELADLISNKCRGLSSSNWCGVIPEIFPNVKYICAKMAGSMEAYLKRLRHYAGEVPLVSGDYGASEAKIAVNAYPKLPPELVSFVVVPNFGYFEFLPMFDKYKQGETELAKPLGLTEIKVGEEYEILITNCAGLYRYRLRDVVKVMGFHNSSPQLKFVCRRNVLLSINFDKTSEKDLQVAVEEASKLLVGEKVEVVDYTSLVELAMEPGHYVIFWELSGEGSEEILGKCCDCIDQSFVDLAYTINRSRNTIGALELRIVGRGTFRKILDHFLASGGSASHFKTPRCVGSTYTNNKLLEILSSNVVKSYFSTAYQ